jgi:hypothetical protein
MRPGILLVSRLFSDCQNSTAGKTPSRSSDGTVGVHRMFFALVTAAVLLVGCANHQQSDSQKQEDKAAAAAAAKDTATIDDARCQSFGYRLGTSGYEKCRKEFDNEHKQFDAK